MKITKTMQNSQSTLPMSSYSNSQHSLAPAPVEPKKKFEISGTEFIVDARYDIIKQIGSGAYGVVVSAIDRSTNQKFAIKKVLIL